MILVTGATSDIGQKLCQLLTESNINFQAMCRKDKQIKDFKQRGINAVPGDFQHPESLKAAMKGCESLFLITPPTQEQVEWEKAAIDAAKTSAIKYIVKVSASDANIRSAVPWAKSHAIIDHYLRGSGIAWTILKPTAFMQNFLSSNKPISRGYLPQVAGNGKVAYIDSRDVAYVALEVLKEKANHRFATYYLTGPETLDMKEIAGQLSSVLDMKVRYLNLPKLVFRTILRLSGASSWFASGIVVQFADVVAGAHALDISYEVKRIGKSEPNSFVAFAREHKKIFKS
ncbi:SDR family oxidoreductase [Zunongwangia pacifica]|uniref:SDR family oxidoreductase n=1 Tax=Zunongwangia pacifica TaxID=2911062 RepID=A0A9X1ZTP8_9FLAO|nr:SDR family oxidoreductase [Zunongwangia pacifica]MCL6217553.1 SDR family oxidoreductase [Zunongwangia pacifica]